MSATDVTVLDRTDNLTTNSDRDISKTASAVPSSGKLLGYATGSMGMGIWVTVPGLLLLYYMTSVLGVSPWLAGLALLLPKAIDVVVHPWFGAISDRQRQRFGHRRHMMWAGLFLAVAMVLMFSVPTGLGGVLAAVWVAVFYIIGNMLFASFQVPYLTTPSDADVDYNQRTRFMSYRMVLLTIGLLAAGLVAPMLVKSGTASAYTTMAICLGIFMVITGIIAIGAIKRLRPYLSSNRAEDAQFHPGLRESLRVAWQDRNFRVLAISYLFTVMVTHLFMAAVPFYAEYIYGSVGLSSVFLGAFLAPAVLATPVWLAVSKRIGKQRGLIICQVTFIVGSLMLLAGAWLGLAATVAIVVVLGTAFAGLQLFAFSMVPDVVRNASEDGSKAASYTGVWTAIEATGTAIGPYLYSAVLAIGGFVAATGGAVVTQPTSAITALVVGFTVIPALLMVVAILFQRRYTLDSLQRSGKASI